MILVPANRNPHLCRELIAKAIQKLLKFAMDEIVLNFDLRDTVQAPEIIKSQKGPFLESVFLFPTTAVILILSSFCRLGSRNGMSDYLKRSI